MIGLQVVPGLRVVLAIPSGSKIKQNKNQPFFKHTDHNLGRETMPDR